MNPRGDYEAERIVLAYYLVARSRDVRDAIVTLECFQHHKHRDAWVKAMLAKEGLQPADLGFDADDYALLCGIRPSDQIAAGAEKRLIERWQLRTATAGCRQVMDRIGRSEIQTADDAISAIRTLLAEVEQGGILESETHAEVGLRLFRNWLDAIKSGTKNVLPMPLDVMTRKYGGFIRGKFFQVGAVTSGHKTTFARMCAWHAAKLGFRSMIWTMEDSAEDLAARTFAQEIPEVSTRTFSTLERPDVPEADFARLLGNLGRHLESQGAQALRYIDEPLPKLSRVIARISAEKAKGLDFVVLDFMQLITPDGRAPESEATHWFHVSNSLAALAKRLDLVVMATVQPTQMSTRELLRLKKPLTMGDFRGGSAITQAAYGVIILNPVWAEDGERDKRYLDLDVAKWKSGEVCTMRVDVKRHKDTIGEG